MTNFTLIGTVHTKTIIKYTLSIFISILTMLIFRKLVTVITHNKQHIIMYLLMIIIVLNIKTIILINKLIL